MLIINKINYHLFKFRDIDKYTIDSLIKGTIFFSPPEKLNDPFDCNLDVKKSILNASEYLLRNGSLRGSENLKNLLTHE
jgi:hypothetical protein